MARTQRHPKPPPEAVCLLDADWYLRQNRDVAAAGVDPAEHFFSTGWREHRDPNFLFCTREYLGASPDVVSAGVNPVLHYVQHGAAEGRTPHHMFDAAWYQGQEGDWRSRAATPLEDYLTRGRHLGRSPHPVFDPAWYASAYPDVPTGDAAEHFLAVGQDLGFDPHPLFDVDWYLEVHPDVATTGLSSVQHFLTQGWRQGKSPSPDFDTDWYLREYPDVAAAAVDPLRHYICQGQSEGRFPRLIDKYLGTAKTSGNSQDAARATAERPTIDIVIPVYGQWHFTDRCLRALGTSEARALARVIVVDDAGPVDTSGVMARHPWVEYQRLAENHGYTLAVNAGAHDSRADFLLMLNNDTEPLPGFLSSMLDRMQREPRAAIVGSRLIYSDGLVQEAGSIIWADGSGWNYGRNDELTDHRYDFAREPDYCSAASVLVRGDFWRSNGGFDERFAPAYYEDTDLAFSARRAGHSVWYEPQSLVIHHEGRSHGVDTSTGLKAQQVVNQRVFSIKWAAELRKQTRQGEVPLDVAASRPRRRMVVIVREEIITPLRDSGSLRMSEMIEAWRELEFRVVLVSPGQDTHSEQAAAVRLRGLDLITDLREAQAFVRTNRHWIAAIVHSHVGAMWKFYEALIPYSREIPVVFDTVDLHHVREAAEAELQDDDLGRVRAQATRSRELWAIDEAEATVVVSGTELDYLRDTSPSATVHVVSNIHPPPGLHRGFDDRRGMVFIGYFNHTPNLDGITWFLDCVWPLLPEDLRRDGLSVIGSPRPNALAELGIPGVKVHGWVKDTAPFLEAARLSIAPLRYGGGVKGKVGEAWSHGLPVAGTDIAMDGMLDDVAQLPSASDSRGFADLVALYYSDRFAWQRALDEGVASLASRFSRSAARQSLTNLHHQLDSHRVVVDPWAELTDGLLNPWMLPGWPVSIHPRQLDGEGLGGTPSSSL